MVKISRKIELSLEDIEDIVPGLEYCRIVNLKKELDYPINEIYEVHIKGIVPLIGFIDKSKKTIVELKYL